MERIQVEKNYTLYKETHLVTYFYRETILHPFVHLVECKKGFKLIDIDYSDMIQHIEKNGYKTFYA